MLKPSKDRNSALKRADKYFQAYIRERDKAKPCITCGQYRGRIEAGHYMVRQNMCTRYDEKNAHGQCRECNQFRGGEQYAHGLAIDKLYGEGTSHDLYLKSKMSCPKDTYTLDEIANYYNGKIKELREAQRSH